MLTHIERQKSEVIAALASWSPARLAFRPAPGSWCASEVLDHIVKVETEVLSAAREGLPKPHHVGVRDRLGSLFIQRVFRTDRRVKVPASVPQIQPDPCPDFSLVLRRWDAARLDLSQFVGQLGPEQLRLGIIRHPVSGWMDVPRIIDFFSVHIIHHNFQIARLREASQQIVSLPKTESR